MEYVPGTCVAAGMTERFAAVDGVDYTLNSDQAVGIVGLNEADKTNLLNLRAGSCRPVTAVVFGGINTALDAAERCRFGIVRSRQIPKPFVSMNDRLI
jgi:branched-chain amino acid transport system ATP-binding protein